MQVLAGFFEDSTFPSNDDKAMSAEVWVTLIALFIFGEEFSDRESEWTLLASKAKDYLKAEGIEKPDRLIRKMDFDLV